MEDLQPYVQSRRRSARGVTSPSQTKLSVPGELLTSLVSNLQVIGEMMASSPELLRRAYICSQFYISKV